jgi:dUTPase
MINRITAFADSKGNTYGTLDAAQRAEIKLLMTGNSVGIAADSVSEDRIAEWVLTKTRTPKPKRHEAEQFTMPIEDNTKPAA